MEYKSQVTFKIEPMADNAVLMTFDDAFDNDERPLKVRLDKWLWAARFYKTRALARAAIEQGKVLYNGQKAIPTKEIAIDAQVFINHGSTRKTIVVRKLSTRRRSTLEASNLFTEI